MVIRCNDCSHPMEVAIQSRRQIIFGLTLALISGLAPCGVNSALARDGGQGGGNGRGRSGGGNSGKSGRGGGNGNGNNGGSRGGVGAGNRGSNSNPATGTSVKNTPPQSDPVRVDNGSIRIRHGSGIAEEINDRGRYVMRDRSGRTIVNRAATKSDLERLRLLTR